MKTLLQLARRKKDYVSDEMVFCLLEKKTYTFNELFLAVHARLKARNVSNVGEDILRLRLYERLQTFVAEGLVKKTGKEYSAEQKAVQALAAAMAETQEFRRKRTAAAAS